MPSEQQKKTLRHFYCRDVLWQSFERMSEDLDRGIDDLVNEAMRLFAREKGYVSPEAEGRPASNQRIAPIRATPPAPPLPKPRPTAPTARTVDGAAAFSPPAPVPAPARAPVPVDTSPPIVPLYLVFQNQKYLIDKEQFIIGRGSKSSDLPIRDGNISRKHAAVVRRNGAYFIKDLGSTNGIDFNGTRVDNKRIEEGDTYSICEYQLKFTYR